MGETIVRKGSEKKKVGYSKKRKSAKKASVNEEVSDSVDVVEIEEKDIDKNDEKKTVRKKRKFDAGSVANLKVFSFFFLILCRIYSFWLLCIFFGLFHKCFISVFAVDFCALYLYFIFLIFFCVISVS